MDINLELSNSNINGVSRIPLVLGSFSSASNWDLSNSNSNGIFLIPIVVGIFLIPIVSGSF